MAEKLTNSLEKIEAGSQRHPLKRLGEPVDLSNAVCFLLSEKSGWVTGQVLHIDGGMGALKA
jgi:NAD(P)-dependent dehydrogenase (short-subunit alcohol dehydrogenase family)